MKLFDSELKVMDVLWREGDLPAKAIARTLTEEIGWNVNTTYTLIKRCIAKEAIERSEPGFMCRALVSKEQVQQSQIDQLVDKTFEGSLPAFVAAFARGRQLSEKEVRQLQQLIDDSGKEN